MPVSAASAKNNQNLALRLKTLLHETEIKTVATVYVNVSADCEGGKRDCLCKSVPVICFEMLRRK